MSDTLQSILSVTRPTDLDAFTVHLATVTNVVSFGFRDSTGTHWVTFSSGGGTAIPLSEIAFGTGAGITSSANLTYTAATGWFKIFDTANADIFHVRALSGGNRYVRVFDETGNTVFNVSALNANRQIAVLDDAGVDMIDIETRAALRTIDILDFAGVDLVAIDTKAARSVTVGAPGVGDNVVIDSAGIMNFYTAAGSQVGRIRFGTAGLEQAYLTPATLAASETGYDTFGRPTFRFTGNAAGTQIHGFANQNDGTTLEIVNIGAPTITIMNESGTAISTTYRILTKTGGNVILALNGSMLLRYDATTQRWRALS